MNSPIRPAIILGLLAMPAASTVALVRAEEPASAVAPLIKFLESGKVPSERQAAILEMVCKRGNERDLAFVFQRVVDGDSLAPDVRLQAIGWLADAAVTRKVKPAADLKGLEPLVFGESARNAPELRRAAIKLASTWRDTAILPALQRLALDGASDASLRRAAIDGLVAIGDPAGHATLNELVGPGHPIPLRMQAAASLTGVDPRQAARAAASVLADATAKDDPAKMLSAFFERKNGPELLAKELERQPPSIDVAKQALRYMYSVGRSDAALSNVLSAAARIAADSPPPTPAEIAQLAKDVMEKGDPARGERIFRRKDLNCLKCHSVSRAGGQVGPELSALGGSSPIDYVLNSILNPNLAVKEQFATRIFELSTGKILTGVVIDRDELRVNVRDAHGETQPVPTADIDSESEGKSLMPEGITKFLTRDELIDLARFVSELGKPGPYAVRQSKTVQRWRVLREPPRELTDDVPHLDHLRQFALGGQPTDWEPVYAMVGGELPLADVRGDSDARVLILQAEVTVSAAGAIEFRVASDAKTQTWIDAHPFHARQIFETNLAPGRHAITIRAELTDDEDDRLAVELVTPDGSPANYEIVGGP